MLSRHASKLRMLQQLLLYTRWDICLFVFKSVRLDFNSVIDELRKTKNLKDMRKNVMYIKGPEYTAFAGNFMFFGSTTGKKYG